jgi:N6-L-threonylcarbamoyladenine synthase
VRILGIETSCDETAAAVVEDGHTVLSDVVVSQIDIHKRFGGTVPEIASRSHLETLLPVIEDALERASLGFADIDAIAVTHRPGLIGALLVGVAAAKTLALALGRPLIGIHHIAAHIYASWMQSPSRPQAPFVSLVVSGGHTTLFRMDDPFSAVEIGSTIDDAVGEAFDKVAAVLKLGYPGGPIVDKLAREGDPKRFPFKSPLMKKDGLDFTLSGIKTAVLYLVNGMNVRKEALPPDRRQRARRLRVVPASGRRGAGPRDDERRRLVRCERRAGRRRMRRELGVARSLHAGVRAARPRPAPAVAPVVHRQRGDGGRPRVPQVPARRRERPDARRRGVLTPFQALRASDGVRPRVGGRSDTKLDKRQGAG